MKTQYLDRRLQKLEKRDEGGLVMEYLRTILEEIDVRGHEVIPGEGPKQLSPEDLVRLKEIQKRADEIVKQFSEADNEELKNIIDETLGLHARH